MLPAAVTLHPRRQQQQQQQPPQATSSHPPGGSSTTTAATALPQLLQTPSGLAVLELQGSINLPPPHAGPEDEEGEDGEGGEPHLAIGRLDFPDYRPDDDDATAAWMRCVHLYVGRHQRLTGEVRKLPRPLAVIRRRKRTAGTGDDGVGGGASSAEVAAAVGEEEEAGELEVVEIVRYQLVFSQRPEPVGTAV